MAAPISVPAKERTSYVFVKVPIHCVEYKMRFDGAFSISKLKRHLQKATGVPEAKQVLKFQGLGARATSADLRSGDEMTLHVMGPTEHNIFRASNSGSVNTTQPKGPRFVPALLSSSLLTEESVPSIRLRSLDDKYTTERIIGKGGFSTVVLAKCNSTGEKRAVKITQKSTLSTERKKSRIVREKEILCRTRHPNIIAMHECIETKKTINMVFDFMSMDLFEFMTASDTLSKHDVATIMRGLLNAVSYLHENNIVHRDIKPQNILINSPWDVRLSDFGTAKALVGPPGDDVLNTPCGTFDFLAPEIVEGVVFSSDLKATHENVKCIDMWSCGVVLYGLLVGRMPFKGVTNNNFADLWRTMEKGVLFPDKWGWKNVTRDAKDLVSRLLTRNPSSRITAVEALEHPFLVGSAVSPIPVMITPPAGHAVMPRRDEVVEHHRDVGDKSMG